MRHCVSWNFRAGDYYTEQRRTCDRISKEDLNDIYEIRSVMEGLCAKWAAKKATPEQIEELEEIVYLTEFHVSKGHSSQVFELDNKFHETLYQASGSKVLAGVLTDFHNYVQRVRKIH